MPFQLLQLAERERIIVEYWDFKEPLEAIYWNQNGQASIGLSKTVLHNRAHHRTLLAEELGHHFTGSGDRIIRVNSSYKDIIEIGQQEYRALKWAAQFIMPVIELEKAFAKGLRHCWELADYFTVDESLVRLRMMLYLKQERRGA